MTMFYLIVFVSLVFYLGLLGHKHKIHRIKAKKTNLAMKPTILNAIFIFEKETAIVQHFVQIYISMFSKVLAMRPIAWSTISHLF